MRTRLLIPALLLFHITSLAQYDLSGSRHTSALLYAWRLTDADALHLFRNDLKDWEKYASGPPEDSLPVVLKDDPPLPAGTWLLVMANGSEISASLRTSGKLRYTLLNDGQTPALVLHAPDGQFITHAAVFLRRHKIAYDPVSNSWPLKYRAGPVAVICNGETVYFPVNGQSRTRRSISFLRHRYRSFSNHRYEDRFRSYFVCSKPKYKPRDTLSAKAFIMDRKGRPINRPLALHLYRLWDRTDTLLQLVRPYRAGAYLFSLPLTDSLNLRLDNRYRLTLEEPSKKKKDDDDERSSAKILSTCSFEYEEYDLKAIRLHARSDRSDNSPGIPASVFLQAVDENDLPVPDARVAIEVRPNFIGDRFHRSAVFIPDTLWRWTQPLDPVGETRIVLPDSIFPPVSVSYSVICTLLNSDNETDREQLDLHWTDDTARIVLQERGDSLDIECLLRGRPVRVNAIARAYTGNGEMLTPDTLHMPASLPINPYAYGYRVDAVLGADSIKGEHAFSGGSESPISWIGHRTHDSLVIQIIDPERIPFWYTLSEGRRIIRRGYGDSLHYVTRTATAAPYFVAFQYMYEGHLQKKRFPVLYEDKLLHLYIRQPDFVYPGQQADVEVSVKDAEDRPVPNADLTAWSSTAKFVSPLPYVPYLGKAYPLPKTRNYTLPGSNQQKEKTAALDWGRWGTRLGLTAVEYYKLLNPRSLYINREPTADGLTELAPFVSRKGQPMPVALLYIDERLVYFSATDQLGRYSFPVNPGKHVVRIRIADKEIMLDSIVTLKGMKTFVGINDDTSNKAVSFLSKPDTLTNFEKELLQHSLVLVRNSFGLHYASISQGSDRHYLLIPTPYSAGSSSAFLTGPFSDQPALMEAEDDFTQVFEPEPGYEFIIRQGLVREKQWPTPTLFETRLRRSSPETPLSDRSLTPRRIDSLWLDYLDNRNATEDLYINPKLPSYGNGRLRIGGIPDTGSKALFVKSIFIFRVGDADLLRVYKGMDRDLSYQEPGLYRLLVLLKDDRYILRDTMLIRPDGLNFYDMGGLGIQPSDTFSRRIGRLIHQFNLEEMNRRIPPPDSLHFLFNERYLYEGSWEEEVWGRVTNEKGDPVEGATVAVASTRHAVSTDAEGHFHLSVPARGTLMVTYVGYDGITKPIQPGTWYDIRLLPVTSALNEVIVIGYGMQKKSDITASVVSLEARVFGISSINNAEPFIDRLSLSDTAIRFPDLPGVDSGRTIRRRFRDDAFWQPRLNTDDNGIARFSVRYPDDITRWRTFVIAATDHRQTGEAIGSVRSAKPVSARLSLPAFLVMGDSSRVIGKLLNYLPDTVDVRRGLQIDDSATSYRDVHLRNAFIDTFTLHPPTTDSIRVRYTLQRADGYFDGEERTVPVVPAGVQETRGHFAAMEEDTAVQWPFDTALGPVHVHAEASLLPVMLDEIEHVGQYEYLCNEQLASKLMVLVEKKRVYRLLQKKFKEDATMRELITRLEKGRKGNALWGWWPGSEGMPWITLHATEALLAAEKEGYPILLDKRSLTSYLVYSLENATTADKLFQLRILEELQAKVDYQRYIDSIETHFNRKSLYLTLRLQELRQGAGLPVSLDTLIPRRQYTALGNCYWGEEGAVLFDNAIQNTLLMYRLLRQAGGYEPLLRKIRDYLLEKRGGGHWRNTYESGLILQTLLPDLLKTGGPAPTPELTVNHNRITSFPFDIRMPAGTSLLARQKGQLPVYLTAYQQTWNPRPLRTDGLFVVRSFFEQKDQPVQRLRAGQAVTLKVEVEVTADADYVLVEVPIPAGCTYVDKRQLYWDQEVHREYFKNKLSIFCPSLGKGRHVFTIELMPRFTGAFILNPAKAEMLYFPVFYGREEMKTIAIE